MKNLILLCSISLVITSCAVYYALGRYFFGKSISKMSAISKIKFVLMITCPVLLIYASYLIYAKADFMLATIISLLATVVLIVCSNNQGKHNEKR